MSAETLRTPPARVGNVADCRISEQFRGKLEDYSHGFPPKSMGIHGNPWESMEIHGNHGFGGNPWIFTGINIFTKIDIWAKLNILVEMEIWRGWGGGSRARAGGAPARSARAARAKRARTCVISTYKHKNLSNSTPCTYTHD